jgi:hypothetical protein
MDFYQARKHQCTLGLYNTKIDSMILVWPDNTYEHIQYYKNKSFDTITYKTDLPKFDYTTITSQWKNKTRPAENITSKVGLNYLHKKISFPEFDREPYNPRMFSPKVLLSVVADINHDGLEMFSSAHQKGRRVNFYSATFR